MGKGTALTLINEGHFVHGAARRIEKRETSPAENAIL
jgi:NADP-dependent 3-hydroxy acid dehydrogenase YdfG